MSERVQTKRGREREVRRRAGRGQRGWQMANGKWRNDCLPPLSEDTRVEARQGTRTGAEPQKERAAGAERRTEGGPSKAWGYEREEGQGPCASSAAWSALGKTEARLHGRCADEKEDRERTGKKRGRWPKQLPSQWVAEAAALTVMGREKDGPWVRDEVCGGGEKGRGKDLTWEVANKGHACSAARMTSTARMPRIED